jgi:hypothetical protein
MATTVTGTHAFTYVFRSNGTSVDAFTLNTSSAVSTTNSPAPPTAGFPISIAGRNYMVDTSFEPYRREAFRHKSIQPQRQSLHFTNIPDDGTISTEGLWRREARDWSLGAGQIYFDRKHSDDARYYKSKGINPWTQWNTTLLPDVINQPKQGVKAIRVGSYVYYIDATSANVYYFSGAWTNTATVLSGTVTSTSPTYTALFPSGVAGAMLDICTDGYNVYILTTFGLFQFYAGVSTPQAQIVDAVTYTNSLENDSGGITAGATTMLVTNVGSLPVATTGTPSSYYYIQVDSEYMQVTNVSGSTLTIVRGQLGTTAASHSKNTPISLPAWNASISSIPLSGLISWSGDKLMLAMNNLKAWASNVTNSTGAQIFDLSQRPSTSFGTNLATTKANEWIFTHPNPAWVWSGMAAGSSQIYFAGHTYSTDITSPSNDVGMIYRSTITSNSLTSSATTINDLTYPVVALPLPAGEYPTTIKGYLNYVFIGTNKGIRMAETINALDPSGNTGDLKSGPLTPNVTQIPSQPVTAIVGSDRYIYWAWNNYDSNSTGLGRLDLTTFIDQLSPAYASDLMIGTGSSPQQGIINWLDWDPITNSPLMSVNLTAGTYTGKYFYTANPNSCVASGTIDSGLITYGIPDNKNAIALDLNVTNVAGTSGNTSVDVQITTDNATSLDIGTYSGSAPKASLAFPAQQFGEQYRITTTLNAGVNASSGTPYNVSPILNRWCLKALPGIPSGVLISAVVTLYEPNDVDGTVSYKDPYEEYAFLEAIRQSQQVVEYVEGPFTAQVTIDMLDWLPERRRFVDQGGYHGDIVVYLKTVTG